MRKKIIILTIALTSIWSVLFANQLQASAHQFINTIQKSYFLFASKNMKVLETEHFFIRYESEKEEAQLTAEIAEKYFAELSNRFDYETDEKIPIIIYEDMEKMKKTAFMKAQSVPMGLYTGKTIQILSPDVWIQSSENKAEIFEKEGPIIHEMVHYIVDDITKGNHKEWFFEGISLYTEYLYTGYVIGEEKPDRKAYSLHQLEQNFKELNQIDAYYSSFIMIKNMVEENDVEYLNNVLQYLGKGKSLQDAYLI